MEEPRDVTTFYLHMCIIYMYKHMYILYTQAIADAQRDTIWTPTPTWREESRDFKTFTQRIGQLPVQKEADPVDVRNGVVQCGAVWCSVLLRVATSCSELQ